MKDLFYLDKTRSAIFKKYKIYVDVSNVNGDFDSGQKLNSFFGQIGVYEGQDKIIKVINDFIRSNSTSFYFFNEDEDFESSLETEEFSDEEVNVGIDEMLYTTYKNSYEQLEILDEFFDDNFYYDQNEENLFNDKYEFFGDNADDYIKDNVTDEEDYNQNEDNNYDEDFEQNNTEDSNLKNIYYIPLFIFFFYGEKRVNFLTLFSYRKKFYFELQKVINCLNFVDFKEKDFILFKTFKQFSVLKTYSSLINKFKKVFQKNTTYYKLLNLNSIDFFKSDNFLWPWYKQVIENFQRRDKRKFIFKKMINKKYFQINSNIRKMKWMNSSYLLGIALYKGFWYINKFKHQALLELETSFLSQIYTLKKKILKKFKRRKRYKKKITRSFFGFKYVYTKVFNVIEEKKKKRRR